MNDFVVWAFSTGLSLLGLGGSLIYLWMSFRTRRHANPDVPLDGDRPWRRLGAAICALISVMFYAGVHHFDGIRFPRTFAAYWAVILLLVVWLCVLAVRDMVYTRRKTREMPRRFDGTD